MRKGTIHGSIQLIFLSWYNVQLALYKCTSEYILVSAYWNQLTNKEQVHLQNMHYTPCILVQASYIRQTRSPKWSLFSQLVTY